jgi:hypothetical protein
VTLPGKWESPAEVCKRLKISRSKFARRWKRYAKAKPEDVQLGPTRRLIAIRSNPALDVFLIGSKRLELLARGSADILATLQVSRERIATLRGLTSQIGELASVLTQLPARKPLKSKRRKRKKAA